jgi:hypothetical protein
MTQETNAQQQLFVAPETQYGWKSIQHVKRGEIIIVEQQEVKILATRQDGDYWLASYNDPTSEKKTEQLYNATDFVYTKS